MGGFSPTARYNLKQISMAYKISDVTKALKRAGFAKIDAEEAIFGNGEKPMTFYKYKGGLHINGYKVGFCINNASDAKIFGKYVIGAIDADGYASETLTNWDCLFFPQLFGYLTGTITEAEIIKEVCH